MRLITLLALTTAMTATAQDGDPLLPTRVLTDFRSEADPDRWFTVLDGVMGGRSSGEFRIRQGRMVFTGVLNTNGGGFSSVRRRARDLRLGQDGEEGIRLRVRADGRRYTLRLRQPTDRRRFAVSYRAQFATEKAEGWQEVHVPYADLQPTWRGRMLDLPPVRPRLVDEIGISIDDKVDGPFRIEIDEIGTYGAFDFDDYRYDNRPLVVFADSADARELARQLEAVRESRLGFEDRDMELIVVLSRGRSMAGTRPLTDAATKSLRRRFRHDGNGFAVLLVGKDGGVKRQSAEPLPMSEVFAQVDRMPMRIREMREQRDH